MMAGGKNYRRNDKRNEEETMKFLKDYKEGDRVFDIYLCKHKQSAVTKNGKPYDTVILQDRTGTMDAKIWDPNSAGIEDFDSLDYIEVYGDVTSFQGALQVNFKRVRLCREGEYEPSDYLPVSRYDNGQMYQELLGYIAGLENSWIKQLLKAFFVEDETFIAAFRKSSAAKSVHHGFVGGLLEHTLSVVRLCDYFCKAYPLLKRDLLLAAAMCTSVLAGCGNSWRRPCATISERPGSCRSFHRTTIRMTGSFWAISLWGRRW